MTNIEGFIDLLHHILEDINALNQLLLRDQNYFTKGEQATIDQSAVDKLTLKNRMDQWIIQINNTPQWSQWIKNVSMDPSASRDLALQRCSMLWKEINHAIKKNEDLLQVNLRVINENRQYYQHVFQCLTHSNTTQSNAVYDNKAQMECL